MLQNLFEGFALNTNLLTYALLIGIAVDFATGIIKAYKSSGRLSSSKLRDGGFKKAGIILVVVLSYGLSMLFTDTAHVIFNGVQAYYVYTELVSVLENISEMGVAMPKILLRIFGRGEENGGGDEHTKKSDEC